MKQIPISERKTQKISIADDYKIHQTKKNNFSLNYYSKGIHQDKNNLTFLIKRAICYLAKGYFTLSLKDALKTIEIDPNFVKGYYIASLSYLEMHDVDKAEQYVKEKNQRLLQLIQKTKEEVRAMKRQFPLYDKYLYFIKELYRFDAFFPKLEIHFFTNDNRGVISKGIIAKNEIIMAIPKACLISLEVAMTTDIGKAIGKFMFSELSSPKHCLLSAFILTEAKNNKWKFYFDLLPKDFSNFPIFYSEQDLEALDGSPFLSQVIIKKEEMKNDYDLICRHIPSFTQFSFQKFCKARMLISSRIFGVVINNRKTDVLAPYADLLNHKQSRQTQWYYDDILKSFVIQALEDIPEGCEIFDSYGKKSNGRFLLNYGFALDDNDFNEYPLEITFDSTCPLYEQKKILFQTEQDKSKVFYLSNCIYESQLFELLSFLRFMLFNDDINILFSIMSHNFYNDISLSFYLIGAITKELEIKVLKKLYAICKESLKRYPTTYEQDEELIQTKKSMAFNLRNCILLVMSEKSVLNFYMYMCEYCLNLFKMANNDILNKLSTDFKYGECPFEFYIHEVLLILNNTNTM